MLKVNYHITIGKTRFSAGDSSQLVELRSHATLTIPVHTCRLVLSLSPGLRIAPEDPVTVKLGYGQSTTLVFTGIVNSVDWAIDRVSVEAASCFTQLTTVRCNRVYERPSAGDIVKDLVRKAKVSMGRVEPGLKFSAYAVGDSAAVYTHLRTLAQQCGFDFYASASDQAIFAPYRPSKPHLLNYGTEIISLSWAPSATGIEGVEVYGESPSSQGQGEKAYSWLTKKEVKGSAGSKFGNVLRIADPTARTQAVASKIAKARLAQVGRHSQGRIKAIGNADVQLGDGVMVMKMPLSQQNGTFKVTGVGHQLSRRHGFCTVIECEDS